MLISDGLILPNEPLIPWWDQIAVRIPERVFKATHDLENWRKHDFERYAARALKPLFQMSEAEVLRR